MAKKLYTLLDQNDFVTHAAYFEEGQQPANAVPELVTELMVKAKFNHNSRKFTDESTSKEYSDKIKAWENIHEEGEERTKFLEKHGTKKQR